MINGRETFLHGGHKRKRIGDAKGKRREEKVVRLMEMSEKYKRRNR